MVNFNLSQFLKVHFVSKECKTCVLRCLSFFFHCLRMSHKKDARLKWVKIRIGADSGFLNLPDYLLILFDLDENSP